MVVGKVDMKDRIHQDSSDHGYSKVLKNRHISMIAIGGSIGTGLFLGAGGRLAQGGAALAISYALCGFFVFIMVRALGELSMRRPSSGAFVSYAREFLGEKSAYITGWMFFITWATAGMADITAVALYLHYWPVFEPIPQWVLAAFALAIVFAVNILSVKFFGEFEFWFAAIKVGAILLFMGVAIWAIITGASTSESYTAGIHNWTNFGGFFPMGLFPMVALSVGVVYAFGGTEMIGVAAGEAQDTSVLARAVNTMIVRILFFYVGSVILMTLVLPWTAYSDSESPFVTFFSGIGIPHAGDLMQIVVLTAALSSLNAGLYATGRTLRSLAMAGEAPKFARYMNKYNVPSAGIALTAGLGLVGVLINYIYPSEAFTLVMEFSGIGFVVTWISVLASHMVFVLRARKGLEERPSFRLHFAPWSNIFAIMFFVAIVGSMAFNEQGQKTLALFLVVIVILMIGWFRVRGQVNPEMMDHVLDSE